MHYIYKLNKELSTKKSSNIILWERRTRASSGAVSVQTVWLMLGFHHTTSKSPLPRVSLTVVLLRDLMSLTSWLSYLRMQSFGAHGSLRCLSLWTPLEEGGLMIRWSSVLSLFSGYKWV